VAVADGVLVIAYSGGPDSSALLELACRLRAARVPGFSRLRAVHVDHGLQPAAPGWVVHCTQQCARLAVDLTISPVQVARTRGIEDGARRARYAALAAAAQQCKAYAVMTAHHADDDIETFLLQWLRGAGPDGLAGIAAERALGPVRLLRPLLAVERSEIGAYLERHQIPSVEDPSNQDPRFARNALRLFVVPQLARIRSGFRKSAARSVALVGEAAEVLQELAAQDLAVCARDAPPGMLRVDRLAALAPARRTLALRAWLAAQGVAQAPSRSRLLEALDQALGGGRDGRMLIRMGARELRLYRGLLCLRLPAAATRTRQVLRWNGEDELVVQNWGGVLRFCAGAAVGFDPDWLRARPLEVRARTGGERFKPHATRPSKRLKHLFQEAGIPEFARSGLPLLWRDDRLIYVARLGPDSRLVERGGERVRLDWHGEPRLLEDEGSSETL